MRGIFNFCVRCTPLRGAGGGGKKERRGRRRQSCSRNCGEGRKKRNDSGAGKGAADRVRRSISFSAISHPEVTKRITVTNRADRTSDLTRSFTRLTNRVAAAALTVSTQILCSGHTLCRNFANLKTNETNEQTKKVIE